MNAYTQGGIKPLKAARGHARYIDGKMLSVTKYSFQIYFWFHTAMMQVQLQTAEMADIPSLSVCLRRRLSVPVGIEDLSDAEGILLL